jgi:anti-anti-sigma factor
MITKNSTSRTLIIHSVVRFDPLQVEHHRDQIRSLLDQGYRHLIFDLEKTEYINSSGLGMLVEFHKTLERKDGTFRLLNLHAGIRRMLRETHLDRLLPVGEAELETIGDPKTPAGFAADVDPLQVIMSGEILLLTQLHALTQQILALDEPVDIGKTMLEGLATALHSRRGAIFFLTNQQECLELVHWIDRDEPSNAPVCQSRDLKFNNLEFEILNRPSLTVCRLPEEDPDPTHQLFHELGFRHLLAAPIVGRIRQYGLLCLEVEAESLPMQIADPLIGTLTQICGITLEKSALYKQLQMQMSEMNDTLSRLRRSRQALRDASRLAAMGTVVTGLGHQLNNKLAPIIGYLQMLQQNTDQFPPGVAGKLNAIRTSTDDINGIVQKMVQVSGLQAMRRVLMDPAEYLQVALTLFDHKIQQGNIEIETDDLKTPSGLVVGDPELFLQALIAILHRSIASFPKDNPNRRIRLASVQSNGSIELVIEDTGRPPDEGEVEEFLDPLLPFEQLQEGCIFNYNIPRSILQRHKGRLQVQPVPEGGKRVSVLLPLARN